VLLTVDVASHFWKVWIVTTIHGPERAAARTIAIPVQVVVLVLDCVDSGLGGLASHVVRRDIATAGSPG
jgi:hypothetical protein